MKVIIITTIITISEVREISTRVKLTNRYKI